MSQNLLRTVVPIWGPHHVALSSCRQTKIAKLSANLQKCSKTHDIHAAPMHMSIHTGQLASGISTND